MDIVDSGFISKLMDELRQTIGALGKDGGIISPSVYDTAQALRYHPSKEGVEPALLWLLDQQQADGGWGNPDVALARGVPTLAAVLALHDQSDPAIYKQYIDSGIEFLNSQGDLWSDVSVDALPIAAEMILPMLLEQAAIRGIDFDLDPYGRLFSLRRCKHHSIKDQSIIASMPPTYSWETLGATPHDNLLDDIGSIGHSPAATSYWLNAAKTLSGRTDAFALAEKYLQKASAATNVGIPGVLPNVWPIDLFEETYGLYALLLTDMIDCPLWESSVHNHLDHLENTLRSFGGLSFGQHFSSDADSTAVGLSLLNAKNVHVDLAALMQFQQKDHFETFRGELNSSVLSNAHALHALRLAKSTDFTQTESFLVERQRINGWWEPDKWHSSSIYIMLEVLAVLDPNSHRNSYDRAVNALLGKQQFSGGWGTNSKANVLDTSYALIALNSVSHDYPNQDALRRAKNDGHRWLMDQARSGTDSLPSLWLGKELYSPYRVDRAYLLSALLLPFMPKHDEQSETISPRIREEDLIAV